MDKDQTNKGSMHSGITNQEPSQELSREWSTLTPLILQAAGGEREARQLISQFRTHLNRVIQHPNESQEPIVFQGTVGKLTVSDKVRSGGSSY